MDTLKRLLLLLFLSTPVIAYSQNVTGVVIDETGEPLPGVTVAIEGKQTGTVTSIDGSYTIKVDDLQKDVLVFSFIGMKTETIPVNGNRQINVAMQNSYIALDEQVVIGYGTTSRKDLTGSIASIHSETLEKIPVSNIAEAMTGRLTGVQVTTTDGAPDAEIKILVRGGTSITQSSEPLYIVDGFPIPSIADLSPSNIASIDVLKDASSTAIYGARGSNGVIIITTKEPEKGRFSLRVNSYYGQRKMINDPEMLDPYEYVLWQYEHMVYRNMVSSVFEPIFGSFEDIGLYKGVQGNNWKNIVLGRSGAVFNFNATLSGSNDNLRYSANYANQSDIGIMMGSKYNRDNLSLTLYHKLSKNLSMDYRVRYSDTRIVGSGMNEQFGGKGSDPRMKYVMQYPPVPLKNMQADDSFDEEDFYINSGLFTPTEYIRDNDRFQNRKTLNMQSALTWDILTDLKFQTSFGVNYGWNEDQRFFGPTTYYSKRVSLYPDMPAAGIIETTTSSTINTNTLEYNFKKHIPKQQGLTVLLGQEVILGEGQVLTANVDGLPFSFDSDKAFSFFSQGVAVSSNNFYSIPSRTLSFFARGNYSLQNSRYLITATMRADASNKFIGDNRWGYFPSMAVAWRLSEEDFLSKADWLYNLKLRASYGLAGNNNIPSGEIVTEYMSASTTYLPFSSSYSTAYWYAGSTLTNPDLKWETTTTRNIGLDFGIGKGRINGTLDVYLNTTDDLLVRFPISGGYSYQYRNLGSTENKGVELMLNYIAVDTKDFGLDFSFNVSMNRNKVTKLKDMKAMDLTAYSSWASVDIDYDFVVQEGKSLGQIYGYIADGRYSASDFKWNGSRWVMNDDYANGGYQIAEGEDGTVRYMNAKGEYFVDNSFIAGIYGWGPGSLKFKDLNGDGTINVLEDRTFLGSTLPLATGGFSVNARYKGFDFNTNFNYSYGNKVLNANKGEWAGTARYRHLNLSTMMNSSNRWRSVDDSGNRITDTALLEEINRNTTMWTPEIYYRYVSSWMVEDGSYLRLSTLTLGYTLPSKLVKKASLRSLRFYLTATNLFCLTNYTGFDPEVDTRRATPLTPGVDYSAYPKTAGIIFGINLNI